MRESLDDRFQPEGVEREGETTTEPEVSSSPLQAGVPRWAKTLVLLWGLLLASPTLLMGVALCCVVISILSSARSTVEDTLFVLIPFSVGAVCGGGMFWHGIQALQGKPSRPLRLPPVWALVGGFVVAMATGLGLAQIRVAGVLLAPLFILVAAALAPIAAVAWAVDARPGGLTWRRAMVAFGAGATVSVLLALMLEWLFPYAVLWGVLDLGEPIRRAVEEVVRLLAGQKVARALTRPIFLLALLNYAVWVPLVEETVKSVVLLPLLWGRRDGQPLLSWREAFLLGTAAGAGFAVLENLVYVQMAGDEWGGVLAVRALGSAVHPLGTGLTALTWYALAPGRREERPPRWAAGFGLALVQHGIWNGGILLWSALSGTPFFGIVQETRVVGTGIAVGLLALLMVWGAAAAWGLRIISRRLAGEEAYLYPALPEVPVERAVALWAVVCLVVLLPLGLALLREWWGK